MPKQLSDADWLECLCAMPPPVTLNDALERLDLFQLHGKRVLAAYWIAEAGFEEACAALERMQRANTALLNKPPKNGKRRRA